MHSTKRQAFFIVFKQYLFTILNYENPNVIVLSDRLFYCKRSLSGRLKKFSVCLLRQPANILTPDFRKTWVEMKTWKLPVKSTIQVLYLYEGVKAYFKHVFGRILIVFLEEKHICKFLLLESEPISDNN